MVAEQLKNRGIKDARILNAFKTVKRHRFVPLDLEEEAYNDYPLAIGEGQTLSQPYMTALMTEWLEIKDQEKVLEIGTGSGYQSAILSELGCEVYTIEYVENLAKKAIGLLRELGYNKIKFRVGDGTLGWLDFAPFERVIVTAASPRIPQPLIEQLAEKGRLVIPIGETKFNQILTIADKIHNKIVAKEAGSCVFVPLKGKYGWPGE